LIGVGVLQKSFARLRFFPFFVHWILKIICFVGGIDTDFTVHFAFFPFYVLLFDNELVIVQVPSIIRFVDD